MSYRHLSGHISSQTAMISPLIQSVRGNQSQRLMQIRLSGSNIRLAKCEMTAKIHFHAHDLHVFSGCGYEQCQQMLRVWYPINLAITCSVLSSRINKRKGAEVSFLVCMLVWFSRRQQKIGGSRKVAGRTTGANNVWLYTLTLLLFHSVIQPALAMILHLLQEDPFKFDLIWHKNQWGKKAFSSLVIPKRSVQIS